MIDMIEGGSPFYVGVGEEIDPERERIPPSGRNSRDPKREDTLTLGRGWREI